MSLKLLLVDDEVNLVDPMAYTLQQKGFETAVAYNGQQALRLFESEDPDLILLDVLLSGKDGREIALKLKKQEITKHIPIVMMSDHPTAHKTIHDYLADDFIDKPFDIEFLMNKIKAHM